jgi:hypothetical protein
MENANFIAFDGECFTSYGHQRYALLADSTGRELLRPDGISTLEALDFVVKTPAAHWHERNVCIGYFFDLDANFMLRDLPYRAIEDLHDGETVDYHGYSVRFRPGHFFSARAPGARDFVKIQDIGRFFDDLFTGAIKTHFGIVDELLEAGKARRAAFDMNDLDFVRAYNRRELELIVRLARLVFESAGEILGRPPRTLHGPGAIAGALMYQWGIRRSNSLLREGMEGFEEYADLWDALSRAYHGARFENFAWGTSAPAYQYDLNSAYPYALSILPAFRRDKWKHARAWRPKSYFSVWRATWAIPEGDERREPGPLPYRLESGESVYPATGEGWYYYPELMQAMRAFPRRIRVHEGWYSEVVSGTPFTEEIPKMYARRAALKAAGDPREAFWKGALNAMWGRVAQRKGTYLPFYSLAWAGYVTAVCRTQVLRALMQAPLSALSVLGDSVYFSQNQELSVSAEMGAWKRKAWAKGTFVAPGFAMFEDYGGEVHSQTSGAPARFVKWDEVLDQLSGSGKAIINTTTFITRFLAALQPNLRSRQLSFMHVPVGVVPGNQTRRALETFMPGEPMVMNWREALEHSRMVDCPEPGRISTPAKTPGAVFRAEEHAREIADFA